MAMFYNISLGILIAIINQIMYLLVSSTYGFMRQRNVTNAGKSAMTLLFLLQYVNTVAPIILVNVDMTSKAWVVAF